MKPIGGSLATFLASNRQFVYADCYTFYLIGGAPTDEAYKLRFTTAQQSVSAIPLDGDSTQRVWLANTCLISGLRAKASVGVSVDEQTVTLTPAAGTTVLGQDLRQAIIAAAPEDYINAPAIIADLVPPGEVITCTRG